jgi:hypothetical protein
LKKVTKKPISKKLKVTVITATNPTRLTKGFSLREGELVKKSGGILVEGNAEIWELDGHAEFKDLLATLGPDQALTYGIPKVAPIKLITNPKWYKAGRPDGFLPRTAEMFYWSNGPGILMLDYDPVPDAVPLTQEELVNRIRSTIPGLVDATMLWWPSASSLIKNKETGDELLGLQGQRLYIQVANATDIPRAGNAIVTTLWSEGYGHFEVSKSGSLLPRTIVDSTVWQTNRLDFSAGASCTSPLYQDRGEPVIIAGTNEVVNSVSEIPCPSVDVQEKAATEKAKAREAARPAAELACELWIENKVDEMVGKDADEQVRTTARASAKRAVAHRTLSGDFNIKVIDEFGDIANVKVGAVLDEPLRYNGLLTLDPLEPEYENDKVVGKLFVVGARPLLFSFAHGGKSFKLQRQLETVELVKGRTHDAVLASIEIMRRSPDIFDFGGALVTVDQGRVHPLDEAGLTHHLGGCTQYWRRQKMPHNAPSVEVLEDPPLRVVRAVISKGAGRELRPLDAVVTAPTLRPDGSVLDAPGYDDSTGLLFEPIDEIIPVPLSPEQNGLLKAMDCLMKPFLKFPLVGPGDWGVLLAGLLTAAIRPSLPTSPAFGFDAPVQASGKTLLASCIAALATGEQPTVWPHTGGRDDEETRKRLFTALRNGSRAIVWDNLIGVFNSAAMASALTSPNMTDRVLGKSESISIPNRSIILLTGNNLTLAGDMPRRVLMCRIDPKTDRPFARQFELDPLSYVMQYRQEMIVAALTIIRGWLVSGSDRAVGRMASFELWDDLVRQTVAWVGRDVRPGVFLDPMEAVTEAQSSDPEQETLLELLISWQGLFNENYVTSVAVLDRVKGTFGDSSGYAKRLEEVLIDLNGGRDVSTARGLGRLLGYRRDRVVGGKRLEAKTDTSKNTKRWRVCNVG